ncbi:hypothetical protein Bbelb_343090 [Branchiostoma belcheri]|nr:hypothetical protein Bbelb_343090 [Branchiostoma belcheri]
MTTETDTKDTTTPTADNSSEDGAGKSPAPRDEQLALPNSQVVTSSANAAEHHGHDKNCRPSTELDKVQKESAYPSTAGQGEDGAKGTGAQVEKGEPGAQGKKEEPGAQVKKEEPGKKEEPDAQVKKEEPGAQGKKDEPGAQVKKEEPGAQVEKEEPGAHVKKEEAGAQVEKEEPGAQVEREEPGAQVEKEEPGAQVEKEEPGAQVKEEEPGAQVEKEEPGAQVEKEEPGAQVKREEPGTQVEKEEPGAQVKEEEPGAQVEKEEPGAQVKKEEPGAKVAKVEKEEPGVKVEKGEPGAQVEKEEPGAKVKKEEPGAQVGKGEHGAQVKKEGPGAQVEIGEQPGAQVKKEEPGTQVEKGEPGAQVKKEGPGAQVEKEEPGAQVEKEEPGAQVEKGEPGAQGKKEGPGAQVEIGEQPGAQVKKEEPGTQVEKGEPGAQVKKEGPGAQVKKEGPGAQVEKEEPGAQVEKEEPGAQVEKDEPGAQVKKGGPTAKVKKEEPGAQVGKGDPGAKVKKERPGAQVGKGDPGCQVEKEETGAKGKKEDPGAKEKKEEPGAQVKKEEPGAQVKKEEPGAKVAKVEKEEPGVKVEKGEPGAQVEKEEPGAKVKKEEPGAQVGKGEHGAQVKKEGPGAQVEKEEPGAQVEKEEPGAQVEKEEPGAQVEKEEPGAQVKKGGPTAKVKKEEPSTQVGKGDPDAKVKKERPGAQVGKGDPGCQVEKEEPGAQVKKEEPGAQVKKEEPGAQAEKEKPGAKAEQEKPGATQHADGKKTCSVTDKDVEGKHRHNEKTKEKSKGNGSQEKMSKSQRKRMRKKAKAEKRKNLANPAKKDGDSDRQSTEADETKSQHQQDEEEVDTDQREEEDETGADKMMIYFHVLLRPGDFKYDPDQHHVEVRSNLTIGPQGFTTLVKMSTIGKTNDFLVLEGQKAVSADKVAGKAVEYKYAVVKAQGKIRYSVWHQYNDFMLPEESTGRAIFNRVKKAFGLDRAGLIEAKTVAIQMWLPKWRGLYCGDDARHDGNASDALSQIDDVTRGIGGNLIIVQNTQPEFWDPFGFNVNKVIEAYVSSKLDTFHLASEEKQCPTDRLVSALAITYLIRKFGIKLSKEKEEVLFEALSLTVNTEKMTCQGLKEVFAHFEPDYIRELPTAIQSLINGTLLQANPTPKWLLAIPIYHFLRGDSQPFEQPTEDARVGSQEWFFLGGIDFDKLKTNAKWCRPSIKDFLNNISDLLRCDPLLWRTVAAVLELKELEAVCGTRLFTPSESIAALGLTIGRQASRGHLPTSDQQAACGTMGQIAVQCSEESFGIMAIRDMCSVCEYCLGVIMEESKNLSRRSLVVSAVSMVASCMRHVSTALTCKRQESEETDVADATRKEAMDRIAKCYENSLEAVLTWLKRRLSSPIASSNWRQEYESALSYREEPEVWSQLAGITFGEEEVDAKWRQSLADRLNERIKQVRPVYQAELFCQLDLEKLESVIAECFTNAAFTAVESLCQTKQEGEFLNRIATYSPAATKYGKLFSIVLRRTWQLIDERCETSLLRHLLTWQPFLGFFKMYAGASVLKEKLDEDCQEMIVVAISKLEDVERKLLDGTISVEELEILNKFSCRFLELSKIITAYNQGGEESQEAQQPNPSREGIVNIALRRRWGELEAFKEERRHLQKFLGMSEIIGPVDRTSLQGNVDDIVDTLPVSHLCAAVIYDDKQTTANNEDLKEEPKVTFFDLAPHVKAILGPVGRLEKSVLFHAIWMKQAEEARARIRKQRAAAPDESLHLPEDTEEHGIVLSIDQVATDVCQPALEAWEAQRERIETGEITLEDVDKYFGGIMGSEQDLQQEIATLSDHPKACWVQERTEQIRQYHLLGQYMEKATRVNDVRQTYQLTGDFSAVETLLDSRNASFKMRPLGSIDDTVFQAASVLAELTEATSDALNAFVLSKPLVEWMRVHTKDTKELKVFADLASISAGETDIEIDRVNMLLSAGIGYGPLIYDLKEDAGFTEMMQSAQKLETYLTQDPSLPKKLRDMKNHLSWLAHVQESHGSVEKSSLSQAEAINARGIYEIGYITQPKDVHEPLDSVVTLRLSQADGDTDDRHYSVSNLKTLQSKLMLIAGTADKGKEEVEKFVEVFNGVSRLGNVYLRLRRTGSVLFDRWTCILFCNPERKVKAIIDFGFGSSTLSGTEEDLVTEVTKLAKFMESCLQGWLEFVDFKRGVYPELNNFTTEQIVVLRRELANALNGEVASSQAILLLDSVKTLCTANDVQEAFSMTDLDDDEMADDTGRRSPEDEDQDAAPGMEGPNREGLLRELRNCVPDLSDDMAEAALKVSQRGNFNDTLDEAIDWCITNYGNDELVQEVLGQNEDTTNLKEQESAEANLEQDRERHDHGRKVPRFSPLTSMLSQGDLTSSLVTAAKDKDETLVEKVTEIWHQYLKSTQFENMKEYLSLETLGRILQELRTNGVDLPLPSYREVLLCTPETTAEEIVLLWKRATTDETGRIFCLVNIDQLDHDVSVKAEEERAKLMQRHTRCHLVLTCASEKQHQSYIATALEQYRVQQVMCCPLSDIQSYLSMQLVENRSINDTEPASGLDYQRSSVRVVSSDRPGVGKSLYVQRLAEKLQAKMRSARRRASCYLKVPFHEAVIDVDAFLSALNEQEQNPENPTPTIIHLDMSPLVRKGLDYFLFNLTVLGRVMGKDGKVWLRLPWDLYLIERTSGPSDVQIFETSNNCSVPFVRFLPSATCRAPNEILALEENVEQITAEALPRIGRAGTFGRPAIRRAVELPSYGLDLPPACGRQAIRTTVGLVPRVMRDKPCWCGAEDPIMDAILFSTEEFQRPYHYLRHWEAGKDLDNFTFIPGSVSNNHADFLKIVLRGVGHFRNFRMLANTSDFFRPEPRTSHVVYRDLSERAETVEPQLRDYEQSVFCQKDLRDSLPGLRKFVVDFMIIMSKDFATRSLEMADESPSFKVEDEEAGDTEETAEEPIQYHLRRRWENW